MWSLLFLVAALCTTHLSNSRLHVNDCSTSPLVSQQSEEEEEEGQEKEEEEGGVGRGRVGEGGRSVSGDVEACQWREAQEQMKARSQVQRDYELETLQMVKEVQRYEEAQSKEQQEQQQRQQEEQQRQLQQQQQQQQERQQQEQQQQKQQLQHLQQQEAISRAAALTHQTSHPPAWQQQHVPQAVPTSLPSYLYMPTTTTPASTPVISTATYSPPPPQYHAPPPQYHAHVPPTAMSMSLPYSPNPSSFQNRPIPHFPRTTAPSVSSGFPQQSASSFPTSYYAPSYNPPQVRVRVCVSVSVGVSRDGHGRDFSVLFFQTAAVPPHLLRYSPWVCVKVCVNVIVGVSKSGYWHTHFFVQIV